MDFWIDVYRIFNGQWSQNASQTYSRGPPREHPFGDLFRISILYAPRMPADPFARSEFTRSFVFSFRASKRHVNAHTLGGTPPPEPQ